jgi:carboxypeptidase family protein
MTALRALSSVAIVGVLVTFGPRVNAAGTGQAGSFASLSGTASSSNGRSLADTVVRLRNVRTGQLAGTTTSNGAGQFSFLNVTPGTYAVEVVSPSGQLVGVSKAVAIDAGKTVTDVGVTAATPDVAATGASVVAAAGVGPSAGAMTASVIAAAAGLGAAVAVNASVSPSR